MLRSKALFVASRIFAGLVGFCGLADPGAAQTQNRPDNGALVPGGIVVTTPYPSWFLSKTNTGVDELIFRLFSYEGIARNIFVLSCPRDDGTPVGIEFIPPKSLEAVLRARGPEELKPTGIVMDESSPMSRKKSADVKTYQGTYDKIAAFVHMESDKQLNSFLEFIGRGSVRVTLLDPNIQ
jgi:hypothetical protein